MAISQNIQNIEALIEWRGSFNLTGEYESVVEYFENANGYRVLHNFGPHKWTIVIESDDVKS